MKKVLAAIFLCLVSFVVVAQDDDSEYDENYEFPETRTANISFGIGLGLDYGGIGGKLVFIPAPNVALFGSVGYNFNGAGYNGGVIVRIIPDGKVCPYVTAMYGYNGVIVVEGLSQVNKTYYGASIGTGIELHRRDKSNFWNFGMLVPLRSQEYRDDLEALQNNPNIEFTSTALPFAITVGYHFAL